MNKDHSDFEWTNQIEGNPNKAGPYPGNLDEIKLLAFGYDDYDVLCLDTLGKFNRRILEASIELIILELVSADGATKMNILEDYISWGWDVTSGEQFWEPTVSKIFQKF